MSESRIQSLVDKWFDLHELGCDLAVMELCRDCPELSEELQYRISVIRKFEQLANLDVAPLNSNVATVWNQGDETPPNAKASIDLPARLGDFILLSLLGEGGMGAVYLAEDTRLGRKVAVKVIKKDLAATEIARTRFLREARSMAAVDHEHVMTIYAVGEDQQTPFLVMPVLKGESLESRLKRENKIQHAEACRIGQEIAEGLSAAHQLGLIHRDIKPSNIWLEGRRAKVTILDFGLARSIDHNQAVTTSGAVLGTPAYMSPEQAAGNPANVQSDLFSLGALLYRMTTGIQPFAGVSMIATLSKLANHHPDPPSDANPDVPRPLSDLILRLLSKEPSARPASAEEVSLALSQFADSSFASVSRSGVSQQFGDLQTDPGASPFSQPVISSHQSPPGKRRRWLAAGFGGVVAAFLLGVIIITIQKKDGSQATIQIPGEAQQIEVIQNNESIGRMTLDAKSEEDIPLASLPALNSKPADMPQSPVAGSGPQVPSPTIGSYAELNGYSAWIETPVIDDGEGPLTIEMWVWHVPRLFHPMSEFFVHNETAAIAISHNRPIIKVSSIASGVNWTSSVSELALPRNRFAHLAVVLDDQLENRLYLDGQCVATVRRDGPREASKAPWVFGSALWHGWETTLQGAIDEIHIRRGAQYSSEFVPARHQTPDQSTIALYHLDEPEGELLIDASGNERHGRLIARQRRAENLSPQVLFPPPHREFKTPQGITNGLQAVAWRPDSETFIVGGWDRLFVGSSSADALSEYSLDFTGVQLAAVLDDNSILVSSEYGTVAKVQLDGPQQKRIAWRIDRREHKATHLSVDRHTKQACVVSRHHTDPEQSRVLILDATSGDILREWRPPRGEAMAVAILPDGTLKLAAYQRLSANSQQRGSLFLETRELASEKLLRTIQPETLPYLDANRMTATSGGQFLTLAHSAHQCDLVDSRDDVIRCSVLVPANLIDGCATDDGRLLFTADRLGIGIFDTKTKRRIRYHPDGWPGGIALSPDERWFIALRRDFVRIWSIEQLVGTPVGNLDSASSTTN